MTPNPAPAVEAINPNPAPAPVTPNPAPAVDATNPNPAPAPVSPDPASVVGGTNPSPAPALPALVNTGTTSDSTPALTNAVSTTTPDKSGTNAGSGGLAADLATNGVKVANDGNSAGPSNDGSSTAGGHTFSDKGGIITALAADSSSGRPNADVFNPTSPADGTIVASTSGSTPADTNTVSGSTPGKLSSDSSPGTTSPDSTPGKSVYDTATGTTNPSSTESSPLPNSGKTGASGNSEDASRGGTTGSDSGYRIAGFQGPPAGMRYLDQQNSQPGSTPGSDSNNGGVQRVNGASGSNSPYGQLAKQPGLGDKLLSGLAQNLLQIGSNYLNTNINRPASYSSPYTSSDYTAQYAAAQQNAQILAAQRSASANSYYQSYYANRLAAANGSPNVGLSADYPITSPVPTATASNLPVPQGAALLSWYSARRASIMSQYSMDHPELVGTGSRQPAMQTGSSQPTSTSPNSPPAASTAPPDPSTLDSGLPSSQNVIVPVVDSTGPNSGQVVGTTGSGSPYITGVTTPTGGSYAGSCQVTAANAGNCNPGFTGRLCDLGCISTQDASLLTRCQANGCPINVSFRHPLNPLCLLHPEG